MTEAASSLQAGAAGPPGHARAARRTVIMYIIHIVLYAYHISLCVILHILLRLRHRHEQELRGPLGTHALPDDAVDALWAAVEEAVLI